MEVLISAERPGTSGELASLRAWLDSPGVSVPWELAQPTPADGTLGPGVDEICAIVQAAASLPVLIQWIQSWGKTKQEPPPVKVTIIIGPTADNPVSAGPPPVGTVPDGEPALGRESVLDGRAAPDGAAGRGNASEPHS